MIPSPSSHPPLLFPPSQKGALHYEFWEKQVLGDWARQGQTHPEYEAKQFRRAFRLSKPAFNTLLHRFCAALFK